MLIFGSRFLSSNPIEFGGFFRAIKTQPILKAFEARPREKRLGARRKSNWEGNMELLYRTAK